MNFAQQPWQNGIIQWTSQNGNGSPFGRFLLFNTRIYLINILQAHVLAYLVRCARDAPISFFIPEAWEIWTKFLDLIEVLTKILVVDALTDFEKTELASNAMMQSIVSTRWIISRLVSIQSRNLQGI